MVAAVKIGLAEVAQYPVVVWKINQEKIGSWIDTIGMFAYCRLEQATQAFDRTCMQTANSMPIERFSFNQFHPVML
ncbi:hypothetical protein [Nitrosomonas nitrosa]|uniref:hypothetical protein n=1 Tax=Nitrosomonas nitrosa TaxID=52442 RepID=UPI0011603736|nr:hypothetical protein [Nitrosomonas nitrosa]